MFIGKFRGVALCAAILLSCALFSFWQISNYHRDLTVLKQQYRVDAQSRAMQTARDVEELFSRIYFGIRTMARLPAVRSIDRYAKNFGEDARVVFQELYNNLASEVSLSEVYIVPIDLEPDELDPNTGALQTPILTYDQLIVGRNLLTGSREGVEREGEELFEEEIYEYRLMKEQSSWMRRHYSMESNVNGLAYPAIMGREVVTCDNSFIHPGAPNDIDRSGIVYSVPFYGPNAEIRGLVSAVVLSKALTKLLPSGDYALRASDYGLTLLGSSTGQAQASIANIYNNSNDTNLIYSQVLNLKIPDQTSQWILWSGKPLSDFWRQSEVKSLGNNLVGSIAAILALSGAALVIAILVMRAAVAEYNVRARLEEQVSERTSDLQNSLRENQNLLVESQMHRERLQLAKRELEEAVLLAKRGEERSLAASRAKSEFLANMSHEIRTPLNGVMGMINLVTTTELDADQRENLKIAHDSSELLLNILNDILDFSKIEAGKLEFAPMPTNLVKSMNQLVRLFAAKSDEKKLQLIFQHHENFPEWVMVDELRLRQVITNLIGNSLKFTPVGGGVILNLFFDSIKSNQVQVHIVVSDSGIGIPRAFQNVIFEAFSQADSSTARKYGGSGLGLAISSKLVSLMGGEIWFDSKEGVGTSFHITFPCPIVTDFQEGRGKPLVHSTQTGECSLNILLAEDNLVNQRLAKRLLEKVGHRVTLANNGLEALLAIKNSTEPFHVVLMDCQMPEMDGYTATERIRSSSVSNIMQLPIIALTANAMKGDKERCRQLGMNGYVTKPIRPEELYAEISRVLSS